MGSIYRILDTVTGQAYIGASTDVSQRFLQHRSTLRRGQHPNSQLQRLWNKHGEEAFRFEEIEKIEPWWDYERLAEREIHHGMAYGDLCISNHKRLGTNTRHRAAGPGIPFTVSDDTRLLTSTEAGVIAGVSGETIRRAIRKGELKASRKIGVNVLVRRGDVEQWARARARDGEPGKFPETSN